MGLFREYQPQAVIHVENEPLQVYSGEELRQICRTDKPLPIFFYDIFLSPDGKELIALQAREFSYLFQKFRMHHNSKPLEFTKKNIVGWHDEEKEITLWRVYLPHAYKNGIKISLADGTGESLEVDIEPYLFAGHPVARIMQQTMQKDYPPVWIRDHVLFMRRQHGIDRYVFYDNGSQDYRGLMENLREISGTEGIEIVVINWPFPYTRLWRLDQEDIEYDSCVQQAAFNHGFFMFVAITVYGMNIDIDEYLFNHSFFSLYSYIKLKFLLTSFMYIPGVIIPNYFNDKENSIMRANSFVYQKKGYDKDVKYIYKADSELVGSLDIHSAYGVSDRYPRLERSRRRIFPKFFKNLIIALLRMAIPRFRENALEYYHFRGINTGWKTFLSENLKKPPKERESMIDISTRSWDFRELSSFDPKWMPFDDIKKAFKKIGLD